MAETVTPTGPYILVVEDDPALRDLATDMLTSSGFNAIGAASPEAALGLLESDLSVRVIFIDINMPGGAHGLTLARTIRERWPAADIILAPGRTEANRAVTLLRLVREFSQP
jgi:DNA-binding NtrC family response regulator